MADCDSARSKKDAVGDNFFKQSINSALHLDIDGY
jgi:hypothetical protein